jgi:hypothetical protein
MSICFPALSSRRGASAAFSLTLPLLLPIVSLVVAPPPAHAQRAARVRPAFEPKLVKQQKVSGIVRFRIAARRDGLPHEFAPIGSGGWAAVIRVDGHILASRSKLPAVIEWDTRKSGDGIHEVHVAVRNDRADQEVGVEGAQIIVDNAAADTAAEAAELSRKALPRTQDTPTDQAVYRLTIPGTATMRSLSARFSTSPNPLATRATALVRSGSRLYMGLPDGGIKFCVPDAGPKKVGSVVRLPVADRRVESLAVGGGRVWWTTEGGRSVYAYSEAGHLVTRYDVTASAAWLPPTAPPEAAETVPTDTVDSTETPPPADIPAAPPAFIPEAAIPPTTPSAPPAPAGWVRRVVLLRGRVLLMGDSHTVRVLDPRTGILTEGASDPGLLPEGAITGDGAEHLFIAATGSAPRASALVVSVTPSLRPEAERRGTDGEEIVPVAFQGLPSAAPRWRRYLLRAWRSERDGAWRPVTAFSTDADPERAARLAITPDAVATAEREGLRLVTAGVDGAEARDLPYDLSPGMPSSTDRVTIGPSGLWWEQRGIIFRADARSGGRDAFLPWNLSGDSGAVLALAADDNSVWVATTSAGVRRIRPGRPSAADGYNGYVRARLGSVTLRPPTPRDSRVAGAIEAWQGVPYVWGGQSRSGADCSGFVMRMHQVGGVSIPRTSAGMRHSSQGKRVRDELRWGDTLVYPGHCAIYIGDGRTAETVGGTRGGSVSHSSIWVRSSVIVRRFLR